MNALVDGILAKNRAAWKGMEMERINVALEKERFTNQLRLFSSHCSAHYSPWPGQRIRYFYPEMFVRNDLDHAKKLVWVAIFVCEYGTLLVGSML